MKQLHPSPEPARHSLPADLIHELRTPLNQIIGYSEMLSERAKEAGKPEFVTDLERVSSAGHNLLGIIERNFGAAAPNAPIGSPAKAEPVNGALSKSDQPSKLNAETKRAHGHLLVVDDDEGNRDVLSQRLTKQGYAVENAQNGRHALKMLEEDAFDLVLLDIMMPEMDGYEVLQRMKASEELRHVPVIMISALSDMDSVVRCIELGAEDYLPKPFNAVLLKARLSACLEKKHGRDREMQLFDQVQENYKRLQELEKLRDDLTNMIVHDLRTPLTSLVVAIQTLSVVGEVNDAQREVLEIAATGSDSLLNMINSLLDVERFESGTMDLDYTLISLPELIDSALAQVTPLANSKEIALVQEIEPDLPWLNGDEPKLQRVLVNLLGNALKFTPAGGSITLEAHAADNAKAIEFCVRDTGEGIPPEAFERIFEKFGQVDSRKGGRSMSTGLGLAFCKFAVEAHGGQIGVESTLDRGSRFCFTIPVSTATASAANSGGVALAV